MKIKKSIFKAYDIRGLADEEINADNAENIGKAIASESIKNGIRSVAIGRDGRISSHLLMQSLKKGLIKSGCHVIDLGMVPTPVVYFAIFSKKVATGVIVTASHNPKEYNGFKIVVNYKTLHSEGVQNIYNKIINKEYLVGAGSSISVNIEKEYIENIVKNVKIKKKLHVVIDCANGIAGNIAGKLMQELGMKVSKLFCLVDGNFPNHEPDPTKIENLKYIRDEVVTQKADIGFAFDGDGDRVVLIDNNGEIVFPDQMMILYSREILAKNKKSRIIFDVKCSNILSQEIQKNKGEAIMYKTGHSFIKEKMQEIDAIFAGEMSGHFFFKDRWYGFDDAFYAAARMLEILTNTNESCSEIINKLPKEVYTPEIDINLQKYGQQFEEIEKLQKNINFKNAKIINIDGIRVEYENSWGLVRASNTTAKITLRFAATDENALEKIKQEFRVWLKNSNINCDNF